MYKQSYVGAFAAIVVFPSFISAIGRNQLKYFGGIGGVPSNCTIVRAVGRLAYALRVGIGTITGTKPKITDKRSGQYWKKCM